MKLSGVSRSCRHTTLKKRCKTGRGRRMETQLTEPYFVLRFWLSRRNTSNRGHVSFAQDDGTYLAGYRQEGKFVRSRSLKEDIDRIGCGPSLTLKLFYHAHLPNVAAIRTWMKNTMIGQNTDPEMTCASFIYDILQRGGSHVSNVNVKDITPEVLREIVFQMIRSKMELELDVED